MILLHECYYIYIYSPDIFIPSILKWLHSLPILRLDTGGSKDALNVVLRRKCHFLYSIVQIPLSFPRNLFSLGRLTLSLDKWLGH